MTTGPETERQDRDDTDPMSIGTKVGLAAVAALALLIGALGIAAALAPSSAEGSAGASATPTTAGTEEHAAGENQTAGKDQAGAVTVDVEAGDFYFKSSMTTFKVGVPYHFVVHNVSGIPHEFMIVRPIAGGAMAMEDMDKMAVGDIEDSDLPSGATASVDVTFDKAYPAGTLEFACHVGQHYQKGMHLPIVVTS